MRGLFIGLCFLCLVGIVGTTFAQDAQARVTASVLNVRGGPGTAYTALARIRRGETYPIIGRNQDSSWWQIRVNQISGWVSARFIAATNTASVPIITPQSGCAFTNVIAPTCPAEQAVVSMTWQPFERGMMLWRSDTREIYALLNNGIFLNYQDTWNGQTLPQETPPNGLRQPQRGFGTVWLANQPPTLRSSIGWATADESSYTAEIERISGSTASTSTIYLTLPDGRVAWLNAYTDQWGSR